MLGTEQLFTGEPLIAVVEVVGFFNSDGKRLVFLQHRGVFLRIVGAESARRLVCVIPNA